MKNIMHFPSMLLCHRIRPWAGFLTQVLLHLIIMTSPSLAVSPPPSALTDTILSSTSVKLNWTDNSTDETAFVIERKAGTGGTYAQIGTVEANVTTYPDSGLSAGTNYCYRVYGQTPGGNTVYSNEVCTANSPSALTATSLTPTSIKISWTNPSSQTTYIQRKTGVNGSYQTLGGWGFGGTAVNYTDSSLTPNTTYYYRVFMADGTGYGYSNEAFAVTNPPSALADTILSSTSVKLNWTDNSTDETAFVIERKPTSGNYSQLSSAGAGVTTYTDDSLTAGTNYCYRVYAQTPGGNTTYSNEVCTQNAPSGLTASALTPTSVKLTWNGPSTTYYIDRKIGIGGTYSQLAGVGATGPVTYTDSGLSVNTTYYYRIRISDGTGTGYSNEASATTTLPSALSDTILSSTSVKLDWTYTSADLTGFVIERKAVGGSYGQQASGVAVTSYTDNTRVAGTNYCYRVYAQTSSGNTGSSNEVCTQNAPSGLTASALTPTSVKLTWNGPSTTYYIDRKIGVGGTYSQVAGIVATGPVTYTDSGLFVSTTYYYRIRVSDGTGTGYSNEASAVTNVPSALADTILSSTSVKLDWTDNSTDETAFVIERKPASGNYSQLSSAGAGVTTYTDDSLTAGTNYCYRVYAQTPDGNTTYSNEVCSLNAPSGLTASALTPTSVKLTWNGPSTTYYIDRKAGVGGTYSQVAGIVATGPVIYTDSGLSVNTTYYYRIRISDGTGTGYSNEASVTIATIPGVSATQHSLNTLAAESSTIQFDLGSPATVTLKITAEKTGNIVYQTSQTYAAVGSYSLIWDGKDNVGNVVPDEAYLYTLESINGSTYGFYSPSIQGSGTVTCSQTGMYDAYQNKSATVTYSPSQAARVNLSVNFPNKYPALNVAILSDVPVFAGTNTLIWGGRDTLGRIVMSGAAVQCGIVRALSENTIITSGDTPNISSIAIDPQAVNLSYGEIAKIRYALSRNANVSITLTPSNGGSTMQLVSTQLQNAGINEFIWNGLDASDTAGKKIAVGAENYYTVNIQAVNPTTGSSATAKGTVKVGL